MLALESVLSLVPEIIPPAPGLVVIVSPPVVVSLLASVVASSIVPVTWMGPKLLLCWANRQGTASIDGELCGVCVVQQLADCSDTARLEGDEAVPVGVVGRGLVNDDDVLDIAKAGEVLEQVLFSHLTRDASHVDPVLDDVVPGAAFVGASAVAIASSAAVVTVLLLLKVVHLVVGRILVACFTSHGQSLLKFSINLCNNLGVIFNLSRLLLLYMTYTTLHPVLVQ